MFTTLLIPVDIDPQTPIDAYLDITSTKDKILRYYFCLTNKKQSPKTEDLSWYLKDAREHNTTTCIEE